MTKSSTPPPSSRYVIFGCAIIKSLLIGQQPYGGVNGITQLKAYLKEGRRLEQPELCPHDL